MNTGLVPRLRDANSCFHIEPLAHSYIRSLIVYYEVGCWQGQAGVSSARVRDPGHNNWDSCAGSWPAILDDTAGGGQCGLDCSDFGVSQ